MYLHRTGYSSDLDMADTTIVKSNAPSLQQVSTKKRENEKTDQILKT